MKRRKVTVFSAGCPMCEDAVTLVRELACTSCEVEVLDMHDHDVTSRAAALNVRTLPAVVVDGKLAECCAGPGVSEATLRSASIGLPMS
ncbi:MAG: hypothetical protein HKN37_15045 [Rhodothermales bacterium]|nr:hypothetical protein [Rhodothermales bacterium]